MKRAAKTTAWLKFLLGAATTQRMWSYFTDAPQTMKTAAKVRLWGMNGAESVHFLIVSDRTAVWRDITLPLLPPLLPADRLRQDGRQKRKHPLPQHYHSMDRFPVRSFKIKVGFKIWSCLIPVCNHTFT